MKLASGCCGCCCCCVVLLFLWFKLVISSASISSINTFGILRSGLFPLISARLLSAQNQRKGRKKDTPPHLLQRNNKRTSLDAYNPGTVSGLQGSPLHPCTFYVTPLSVSRSSPSKEDRFGLCIYYKLRVPFFFIKKRVSSIDVALFFLQLFVFEWASCLFVVV